MTYPQDDATPPDQARVRDTHQNHLTTRAVAIDGSACVEARARAVPAMASNPARSVMAHRGAPRRQPPARTECVS